MIEIAIVLPILLLLFVGAVELGRMFYTYTTLAKATKVGARYLSTSKDASDPNLAANEVSRAQNLVICGVAASCVNQTQIVPLLAPANVSVTLPVAGAGPKFVRVQIQNYNFHAGAFNLAVRTGVANNTIYNATALTPGTTMRYMP